MRPSQNPRTSFPQQPRNVAVRGGTKNKPKDDDDDGVTTALIRNGRQRRCKAEIYSCIVHNMREVSSRSGIDYDLETFIHYPTDGSVAALAGRTIASKAKGQSCCQTSSLASCCQGIFTERRPNTGNMGSKDEKDCRAGIKARDCMASGTDC